MTETTKIAQEQFRKLAELAGLELFPSTTMERWYYRPNNDKHELPTNLPGGSGSLSDTQVATVLSWLAKAGYRVRVQKAGVGIDEFYTYNHGWSDWRHVSAGEAETLSEALFAAVMELEL